LTHNFKVTFNFEDDDPLVNLALHIINKKIFTSEYLTGPVPLCSAPRSYEVAQDILECYNIVGEDQEYEDQKNLQVPETKGECEIEGLELESTE
jgi:hypothetical protein